VPAAAQEPLAAVAGAEHVGAAAQRVGAVPAGQVVQGQMALKLADPAAAERATRTSSGRLAPRHFGPPAGSVDAATSFLSTHGLTVTSVSATGTLVNFSGRAGAVQAAFKTRLTEYRDPVSGRAFRSAESPAMLPSSLAARVTAVLGLSERWQRRHPGAVLAPTAAPADPVPGALKPSDVQAMYGLRSGLLSSTDGTGQTIGLLELGIFNQANITMYDNTFYPGQLIPPVMIAPDPGGNLGSPDPSPSFETEVELDIEVLQAFAPRATIKVYEAGNTNGEVNNAYAAMVGDTSLSAISTSWGLCEPLQGSAETLAQHNILVNSAVPVFAATGDAGAYDCRAPGDTPSSPFWGTLAVDSPASDPVVTGAGGTSPLTAPPPAGYPSYPGEGAWSSNATSPPQGGGGGNSIFFGRPPWQSGAGTDESFSVGARQVPDVSLAADPQRGYAIYTENSNGVGGNWYVVGGTSAAAPGWAAATALLDQYLASQGAAKIGPGNPVLYSIAQCPQSQAPFHDVTSGTNLFYPARTAWDFATGWGSMSLGALAAADSALGSAPLQAGYLSNHEGPGGGGQQVSITGCGFTNGTTVDFGGTPATTRVVDSTVLTVSVPAHAAGSVTVHVSAPGRGTVTAPGAYLYDAATVLAVTAPDRALWTSSNLGGFNSLGGILSDAPAVINGPAGTPLFIGTAGNHDLYVRSYSAGWQPLTDSPVYCVNSPAAAIVNGGLVVGCRGSDNALWAAWTSVPASGLPVVPHGHWISLGGILSSGPAVTGLGGSGVATFMVVGIDSHIYQRSAGDAGFTQFPWICTGHPALATYQSTSYFACQGQDRAAWYATYSGGWSSANSLGGVLVDGPGIAVTSSGPQFFVEGRDQAVYTRTLGSGWLQVGGVVNFGAAATGLN
jgi:kumamolisin